MYRLIATNPHGTAYDKCNAYVRKAPVDTERVEPEGLGKAPKVIIPLENVRVPEKEEFVLRCKFSGEPRPTIKWFKDGERLFPYERIQITELDDGTCELRVPSSSKSDAGNYRCIAENPAGTAQTACSVTVICGFLSVSLYYIENIANENFSKRSKTERHPGPDQGYGAGARFHHPVDRKACKAG